MRVLLQELGLVTKKKKKKGTALSTRIQFGWGLPSAEDFALWAGGDLRFAISYRTSPVWPPPHNLVQAGE